ncbi:lymphocyte expansion molecule isoform X1 [Esox lucius]|uniref:Lymphocyte expansion molecule n=1 Tax=Esox lucius TaxID=8010 RepID=A0A3P8XKN9_ESOLU|nr:lymphocyte expansion molecule isoform X1 [Esox lucius]XP_028977657.2 lymphocyte expansion molecule isoform X1 [Esox lucius]
MAEKKFKGAPFGTQMARFDVSAVHPANKRAGTYTEIPYCKKMTNELERRLGPGSYDVASHGDFSVRSVSERAKGLGWQRAQETARLAAICNPFQRGAWESKRFLTTKLGPGSYRTGDFIEKLQKKPGSVRGVCDTREERFRKAQSCTPGPGCYGKGGVPWAALEEKRVGSNRATNMHFSSSLKRFPEASATDSGLSPCTYTLKSSTELLLASGTSKRGPYDLFTGSRDKPITGFYAVPKHVNLTSGRAPVVSPPLGEEPGGRQKPNHGKFGTLAQYPAMPTERIYCSTLSQCPRPATSPGPGWYEGVPPKSRPTCHPPPPFLCSASRTSPRTERLQNGNYGTVGPGRYNIAGKGQSKKAKCPTSSFSSRTQRYLHTPERDKYAQERLRAVNVPVDRRSFLVPPRRDLFMTAA